MTEIEDAKTRINKALDRLEIHKVREDWPTSASVEIESDGYSGFDWEQREDKLHFTIYHDQSSEGVQDIVAWLAHLRILWSKGYSWKYSILPNSLVLLDVFGGFGLVILVAELLGTPIGFILSLLGATILLVLIFRYNLRMKEVNAQYKAYLEETDVLSKHEIDKLVQNSLWKKKSRSFLPFITIIGLLVYVILMILTAGAGIIV